MTAIRGPRELMPHTSEVLGLRVPRIQGEGSVTGEGRYVSLMRLPGMLFVRMVRCPYARARILRVDARRAEALPGVAAVIHRDNVPAEYRDRPLEPGPPPRRLLQADVLQMGMPVAVVVAESEHAADDAVDAIEVEYEVGAPLLDYLRATNAVPQWENGAGGTIRAVFPPVIVGEPDAAFAGADVVIEQVTTTPYQHHVPIELRTGIYRWLPDDVLEVHLTTHEPYHSRSYLAKALGIPADRVRLIQTGYMGSSYGLADPDLEELVLPAIAARVTGRPVRYMQTREDNFLTTTHRGRSRTEVRLAVDHDGTMRAVGADITFDGGANAGSGDAGGTSGVRGGRYLFQVVYDIPHHRHDGVEVFTNNFRAGPMRGVGRSFGLFALETAVEKAAYAIGADPLELRLRNLNERGTRFDEKTGAPGGRPFTNPGGGRASLLRAAEMIDWKRRWHAPGASEVRPGVFHGIAIVAAADRGGGYSPDGGFSIPSTGQVLLHPDGTLEVLSGSADQGAGQRTLVAMIAAQTLGVPLDDVLIAPQVDTAVNTDTGPTHASFQMNLGGWGVFAAARDARRQLLEAAARHFAAARGPARAGDYDVRDGVVFAKADGAVRAPIAEVLRGRGAPLEGVGVHDRPDASSERVACGAHAAEVEVDTATGLVRVVRYVAVHDVGRVLNRLAVEQQIEGGVLFGLGGALFEELLYDGQTGLALNANILDYKAPAISDFPRIELDFVEFPQAYGPYGALAVGQASTPPTWPVVVNAVHNALGLWLHDLPLTRKKVLDVLRARR